jgi:hypothetical protein
MEKGGKGEKREKEKEKGERNRKRRFKDETLWWYFESRYPR